MFLMEAINNLINRVLRNKANRNIGSSTHSLNKMFNAFVETADKDMATETLADVIARNIKFVPIQADFVVVHSF